jgi:anaerobic nitric oxide reductase transcription regulator
MQNAWQLRPTPAAGPHHRTLDDAIALIRACRLDDAERLANSILLAGPNETAAAGRAHSFRGEIASIRGDLDETMREYERAIACLESSPLAGSLARARRGRAEALLNLAMYNSALEEAGRARLLVDSIDDERVRRRAELESALCEGLIRVELGQASAARELWVAAGSLVDERTDPLLVGLLELLGGLALTAEPDEAERGLALLDRAARHFGAHGLPYYRARALESHARRVVGTDPALAAALGADAAATYRRAGALLRATRTERWLADARPRHPAVLATPRFRSRAGTEEVEGIILAGPSTRACAELALCAAASGSTVLITGESGTGKELVARLIHRRSRRADRPWTAFNCATVPADMIESILFGHRRGAFTGAHAAHEGLVRAADRGTFFLDEIGELPLPIQAKLLRFLQEGEVLPLGETRSVPVDVRIVAATNRDLERDTREGRFRADLFHRLNVIRIQVAPLRERREEIPLLARRLAASIGARLGVAEVELTAGTIAPLLTHDWPGNVRELANVLERAIALYGSTLTRDSIEASLAVSRSSVATPFETTCQGAPALRGETPPLSRALDDFERAYIERVLTETGGNCSQAARRLDVSLQRLRYRMRRLGMG